MEVLFQAVWLRWLEIGVVDVSLLQVHFGGSTLLGFLLFLTQCSLALLRVGFLCLRAHALSVGGIGKLFSLSPFGRRLFEACVPADPL